MKLKTTLQLLILLNILIAVPREASADQFAPETVAELIAAINAANSNSQPDIIDLGGQTFTLTGVHNDIELGPTGLPLIRLDGNLANTLTIRNGTIERDGSAANFRVIGIHNFGTLILRDVTIRGGDANEGGGIFVNGILEVREGSTITGNTAGLGAAIRLFSGEVLVENSTISGNFGVRGSAIHSDHPVEIQGSTISNNMVTSANSAAIEANSLVNIVNSTLSGNSAAVDVNISGEVTIINSTLVNNGFTPWFQGSALHLDSSGAKLTISNSVLAGNWRNCEVESGTLTSGGHNLSDDSTCGSFTSTGDQTNIANAMTFIGALADNGGSTLTHALLPGSTAIDGVAGGSCVLSEDQRGELRPGIGSALCDIGAFELQGELSPATDVTLNGVEGWRFMTSPVIGETYGGFLGDLWIQGVPGSNYPAAEFPNLYTFDQQEFDWEAVPNMTGEIGPGSGFIIHVFEDDNFDGTIDPGEAFPKTLTSAGNWLPLDGNFAYTGIGYRSGDPDNSYFLLGNPHPVPLDFCAFTSTNIAASVDFWDPAANGNNGDYVNLNCSADEVHIAPFQAFWVRTTAENPALSIPAGAYLSGNVDGYFKERSAKSHKDFADLVVNLYLASLDKTFTNTTRILLSEEGTAGLDELDGLKLSPAGLASRWLSFYSMDSGGRAYAFQSVPQDGEETISIPLDIQTTEAGRFAMLWELPELTAVTGSYFLRDNHSGQVIELKGGSSYRFEIKNKDAVKPKGISSPGLSVSPSLSLPFTQSPKPRFELLITTAGVDGFTQPGDLPTQITLNQNYPNPFNPTTVISYQLPDASQVRLEVYDMLGRWVATLVDGTAEAGTHQVSFDGSRLSSGVYLYRLQTDSKIFTKKLTLIK